MTRRRGRRTARLTLPAAAAATTAFALFAKPRATDAARPALFAALGTAVLLAARPQLGTTAPQLRAGLRWGAASAALAISAVGLSSAAAPVRRQMATRPVPAPTWHWLLVRIPLGAAWTEEAVFRGAMTSLAVDAYGERFGHLFAAAAFGLWHIPDARSGGEPVAGTVLVTGVAGWVFGWLHRRSGSLVAPLLAHMAVNEAGAVAALLARRSGRWT